MIKGILRESRERAGGGGCSCQEGYGLGGRCSGRDMDQEGCRTLEEFLVDCLAVCLRDEHCGDERR